ncbi:hypothetical protein [Baaleninema sp.]|uniref:hypothetical protein n=1 Tax=Baaleninema sp. TaxID=3101197 RepID=UPI003CFEFC9D
MNRLRRQLDILETWLHYKSGDRYFWGCASLGVSLYFGLVSLVYAFSFDYIVQDDARQHIVGLQRFIDPALFPNDAIADYFLSVAPLGYRSFYAIPAQFGLEPLVFAKFVPLGLSLLTTGFWFSASLELVSLPSLAFLSATVLNETIWMNDDLSSATPRAFLYPLFAAFCYFLLRENLILLLICIALQGLFYPQIMLLEIAILGVRLLEIRPKRGLLELQYNSISYDSPTQVGANGRSPLRQRFRNFINSSYRKLSNRPKNSITLTRNPPKYRFFIAASLVSFLVLLPFFLNFSESGTVVTTSQMKTMPEYGFGGRNEYFGVSWFRFLFHGSSGLRIPIFPSILPLGLALPILIFYLKNKYYTQKIALILYLILASLVLFTIAHIFLLKFHFPSRYTYHSFRFVLSIASAIAFASFLDLAKANLQNPSLKFPKFHIIGVRLFLIFSIVSLLGPLIPVVFLNYQGWQIGKSPEIYEFLAQQPIDTKVASLLPEANNIPAFSGRSILVGREFAIPHQVEYYRDFRNTAKDVIRAHYTDDETEFSDLVRQRNIDFFFIDNNTFNRDFLKQPLKQKDWLFNSLLNPVVSEVISELERGKRPVLLKKGDSCVVVKTDRSQLIDANCVTQSPL